jgi:iron(III) transport system ATP-binding protein
MQLEDSIYLGDRWEYRLQRGGFAAKAHGPRKLAAGKVWASISADSVWIFPPQG